MKRYEVRNAEDQGLCGLTTSDPVQAVRDRATGTVSIWTESTPPMLQQIGMDPLYEGGLTLVALSAKGTVTRRTPVPVQGEPDPSTVVMPEDDE